MGAIESPTRIKLTVDQYYRITDAGVFPADARLELINGEIFEMSPIGTLHAGTVDRLAQALILALGRRAIVGIQRPVQAPEYSEPQPDLVLLPPRDDFYTSRHPLPEDVLLVIEVADTSLQFDRTVKARLYAAHGVPEYWVVDARSRTIEVFRSPHADGYAEAYVFSGKALVSPLAFVDCRWTVDELLG
jgi:Uma2 family endonuclease